MSETVEKAGETKLVADTDPNHLKENYGYKAAFQTWRHASNARENESKLLSSALRWFPNGDKTRFCEILDVDIDGKNHIHEFYIENKEVASNKTQCRDMVMVHGYGAALGLFMRNFDELSEVAGIRIHAIDMLGYGLSSRPKFPGTGFLSSLVKRGNVAPAEVTQAEDFFVDSIEAWRKKRNLKKFVLVGHSLGGYLSCCYALKYPDKVEKLILVSPVGVETSIYDLTRKHSKEHVHAAELGPDVSKEITNSGETPSTDKRVANSSTTTTPTSSPPKSSSLHVPDDSGNVERIPNMPKIFTYMWTYNISPFSFLRALGPIGPLASSRWSFRRFSFAENSQELLRFHEYCYSSFTATGSGEYALTRILAPGVLARLPLLSRVPGKLQCPSLWMYGSNDWMSKEAGSVIVRELNKQSGSSPAEYSIIPDAGHHLYLDNPSAFNSRLKRFLGV
ncbi:LAMI_0G01926g1_1 [Lachancea mirantina]|uniref:LAMI_0G01926g1_1 n=1 Tax=Lachancea mirantina TaxID=1230905 RepID=A0A1G4K7Q5_9SACH|nr:LAMI_0G01926g1_1 [Lachancea mirantina]